MTPLERALHALFSPEFLWFLGIAIGTGVVTTSVRIWRGAGVVQRRIDEEPPS